MAFHGFFNDESDWGGDGTNSTTVGSYDPDYQANSITVENNRQATISWGAGLTDMWLHFTFYRTSGNMNLNADGWWWNMYDASGQVVARCDISNGDIRYEVSGNGGSGFTTGAFGTCPGLGARTDVDIHYQSNNGGNTTLDVYHGGALIASLSATNTTSVGAQSMVFEHEDMDQSFSGIFFWYSEIMVADEDTRGLRVATLVPDGNGGETAWDGVFGDILARGDGKAISSDTAAQRESWTLSAYGGPASPTAVRGVFTQMWAVAGSVGPTQIEPFLRISATNYDEGTPVAPNFSTPVIGEWATNPATAVAWVGADFASLEAGVESVA